MRYLILVTAAFFVAQGALAQSTTAPADTGKPVVKQPSGATAAKNVGTHDMTGKADAYLKAQDRKRARQKTGPGNAKVAADADTGAPPRSLMTDEERVEHRKKLHSAKTLEECERYQQDYEAKVAARANEQHKPLRAFSGAACNRFKVAASKPGPARPAAK